MTRTQRGIYQNYVTRFRLFTAVNYTLVIVVGGDHSFLSMESDLVINCSPDDDTHVTLASSQQLIELWSCAVKINLYSIQKGRIVKPH